MVRIYQRKYTNSRNGKTFAPYQSYSKENLENAIEAVKSGKLKLTDAAATYDIPKSTLCRKYRNLNCTQNKAGHPTLFTPEEENSFIRNILILSEWGFPFDCMDLRVLAQKYLNKIGKNIYGLKNNLPGTDWARNFLIRHKSAISNRKASNISTDRAKITSDVIDSFFDNYVKSVDGVTPDCIINYDETNLTDDPGCKNYIYKRGTKYPERVVNHSKTAISLMFTGTADGELLPIYVVYKSDHLWDMWVEGGPEGTRYNRSKSGWFDSVCFQDWFDTIIVPYARKKAGRKVLIGDNLSSHFSENVLKTCEELNIAFVCLPPKTTHLLQPLDVAFFGPLKTYWRDVLTHWKLKEGRKHKTLVKSSFPKLLGQLKNKLFERGAVCRNLEAGFSKSGLYPINPELPKSRLPQRTNITDEQINNATLLVVTDLLQEIRNPPASAEIRRKKKCNVQPGKSITAADLVQSEVDTAKKSKQENTKGKKIPCQKKKKASLNSGIIASDVDENRFDLSATRVMIDEDTDITQDCSVLANSVMSNEAMPGNDISDEKENEPNNNSKKQKLKFNNTKTDQTIHKTEECEDNILLHEQIEISQKQDKKLLNIAKGNETCDQNVFEQKDLDLITEYIEENYNKKDLNKKRFRNEDKQLQEWTIQENILNEKTGFVQTFITTTAIIEKQKSPMLTEKSKLKSKAHSDFERENIGVDYNHVNSGSKENIDFSDNTTIGIVRKLKRKSHAYTLSNKTKNKPAKRMKSTDSTTTEELSMSVHSDSDLYDVDLEQMENLSNIDLEHTEDLDIIDLEDDEVVKRKNDEREAEIFNEIMRMESQNETWYTKTQDNETETQFTIKATDEDKTEKQLQTEEELHTENKEWNIGDNVLVRYYQKKKWQYYIGLITDINDQIEKKYKISYYKTISKKGDLIFKKPKRSDVDCVPDDIILKQVELLQINENNEFVLFNEEDLLYF